MFLTTGIAYCNLVIGIICKSEFMYKMEFLMSICGIFQLFISETKAKKYCYLAVAVIFTVALVVAVFYCIEYGQYCADYSLVAAQLLLLTIYTLLSLGKTPKETSA